MPLSPQEIEAARKKYGITPQAKPDQGASYLSSRAARLQAIKDGEQAEKKAVEDATFGGKVKNFAKAAASPFVKAGVTGLAAADSAFQLATGDKEGAEKTLMSGYNVPGFGQVRPIGGGTVDKDTGKERYQTGSENLRDIIGTGAEIAPYFMTGGAAGAVGESFGAKGIFSAIKTGAKLGAVQGGIGSAGQSLQREDASVGNFAKDTAIGTVAGGLIGGALGGAGAVASKGTNAFDGSLSKTAKAFSTIDEDVYNAAKNPETAQQLQSLRKGVMPEANIPEVPDIPQPQRPMKAVVQESGPLPGSPEELKGLGQSAYQTAVAQKKAAGTAYGEARKAIIDANEGRIIARSKDFVTGTNDALKAEGLSVKNGKVDLSGSQFEGAQGAKGPLQRVYDIMTRPAVKQEGRTVAEDLLTRREALSNVLGEIPPDQANLRRVVGNMREAFDDNLDNILGTEASAARSAYAGSMKATKPVIDSMTKLENGKRVFSEDKAFGFVDKALKDTKFDNTKLLQELDSVAGSAHAADLAKIEQGRAAYQKAAQEAADNVARINAQAKAEFEAAKTARAQALAEAKRAKAVAQAEYDGKLAALKQLNKSLTSLSPEVTDSLIGTMMRGINGLPVVGKLTPFFAPKFWGDIALSRGLSAAGRAGKAGVMSAQKAAQLWVLTNLIAHESTKDGLDEGNDAGGQ